MPASSQERRKSDAAAARSKKRELFKEEDVKLQWSTVRKAVSLCPFLHVIAARLSHPCMRPSDTRAMRMEGICTIHLPLPVQSKL